MLHLSELLKVIELKRTLGIPFTEGACFGVHDPGRLRPPFKSLSGEKKKEKKRRKKK